jgi:2'-5' RNA ligase
MAPPTTRRFSLFFALRPDAVAAARAQALSAALAAATGTPPRPNRQARLHVTLCHIGYFADDVPASVGKAAREAMARVARGGPHGEPRAPFDVAFGRAASFAGKPGNLPVVLLGADRSAALMALQADLDEALLRVGLVHGERHPLFNPHLTLFYGRQPLPERAIEPIGWHVDQVVLFRSVIGEGRYEEEGVWPLGA